MRIRVALIGAFLAVVTSGTVFGQGFQGGLRGSVKDSGGVIPGVEVTLTNERTNISAIPRTNERGEYVFTNVDPGQLTVKAILTATRRSIAESIRIGTQQFLTLDLTMEVGAIEESITVTGQSPLIETSNASQGTVLDSETLQTLPAPGPRRVPRRRVDSDGDSPRATASTTASRIRPTRRCCRSAAARAAATTTCSTACRSPT
jgi:hypothetical protein